MSFEEWLEEIGLPKATVASYIGKQWVIGGVGGGNCWASGDHYPRPGETEPEFDELHHILDLCCPTISFLAYKKLITEAMEPTKETEECEYYGNYTRYATKRMNLWRLYEHLRDNGLLKCNL